MVVLINNFKYCDGFWRSLLAGAGAALFGLRQGDREVLRRRYLRSQRQFTHWLDYSYS
ncbi:MAG TPA: hypothetical protein V6D02_13120 [Candidatus Obscuribacterales bacterium]